MYSANQTNQTMFITSITKETPFAFILRDTRFTRMVQCQFKNMNAAQRRMALKESRIIINKIRFQFELYKDDPSLLD